jgi:hypothetical protein
MNDDEQAAEAAGAALEAALLKATRSLESELSRILRTSESDLQRLALNLAETLARLAISQQPGAGAASPEAQATSFNEIAAAVARAAMRGSRFT